jgi:hypothetical protein
LNFDEIVKSIAAEFRSWFDTSPQTEFQQIAEAKTVRPEVSKGIH